MSKNKKKKKINGRKIFAYVMLFVANNRYTFLYITLKKILVFFN